MGSNPGHFITFILQFLLFCTFLLIKHLSPTMFIFQHVERSIELLLGKGYLQGHNLFLLSFFGKDSLYIHISFMHLFSAAGPKLTSSLGKVLLASPFPYSNIQKGGVC